MKTLALIGIGLIALSSSGLEAWAAKKHKFVSSHEGAKLLSVCTVASPTREQILSNGDVLCCYRDTGKEICTLCENGNDECLLVVETPRQSGQPSSSKKLKGKYSPAFNKSSRPVYRN